MASLTALSKGLIGLAVVGAMASTVWHLALKERFTNPVAPMVDAPAQPAPAAPVSHTAQANGPSAESNAETGRKLLASGNHAQARIHLEQAVHDLSLIHI